MSLRFAQRMDNFKASDIREILKVTANPEIISFAGGLPAPELFPVEEMKEICTRVLDEAGQEALQYSTTEGFPPLREKIAERVNRYFGTSLTSSNIIIMSGSQQALDFSGKVFLNEGDAILCEKPTYLGAIMAFNAYQPRYVEVATDDEGMVIEDLERVLREDSGIRLAYVIPDFQNPTGKTWSEERRKAFMEVISRYDIPVLEDNPYGELRFEGEILPSLKSMDEKGQVIMLGTFSKIFCPGLRIAWICADEALLEKFVFIKQAADLHTATMAQREISAYMDHYDIDAHVKEIIAVYGERRKVMLDAMDEFLPDTVTFNRPDGGLFTWVELPEGVNARDLLVRCLELKVAFVPGGAFFPNGGNENTLRLNYSNMPPERIREGIRRLGEAMKEFF